MSPEANRDATRPPGDGDYPEYPSHYRPRTSVGWVAVVGFLAVFALTQPPFVHYLANRVEPWVLGFPFLYSYLLIIYCALISILIWAERRGL